MEKVLTIVIPAYNMEKFLPYCLDSLLIGPGLEDVEVLVVNDGSVDRTSAIAHEYEERFPEVFSCNRQGKRKLWLVCQLWVEGSHGEVHQDSGCRRQL